MSKNYKVIKARRNNYYKIKRRTEGNEGRAGQGRMGNRVQITPQNLIPGPDPPSLTPTPVTENTIFTTAMSSDDTLSERKK